MGRVEGGHLYCLPRRDPQLNGPQHIPADMALPGDVVQVLVVGTEDKPVQGQAHFYSTGEDGIQVPGGRAFPHLDGHAAAKFFQRLLEGSAFVIARNPQEAVSGQFLAGEARGVAVDGLSSEEAELLQLVRISGEDCGAVHYLSQAQHPGMVEELGHLLGRKGRAVVFKPGGGHAGGQHEVDVEWEALRLLQEIGDPLGPQHIGDFMGVGNEGGGAPGKDFFGEQPRGYHGGFQVHVGVDQAGDHYPFTQIHLPLPTVRPHPDDDPILHGDVTGEEFPGEHIENQTISKHQLWGFLPQGMEPKRLPVVHKMPSFLGCAAGKEAPDPRVPSNVCEDKYTTFRGKI